jgi:hypothetical protein
LVRLNDVDDLEFSPPGTRKAYEGLGVVTALAVGTAADPSRADDPDALTARRSVVKCEGADDPKNRTLAGLPSCV